MHSLHDFFCCMFRDSSVFMPTQCWEKQTKDNLCPFQTERKFNAKFCFHFLSSSWQITTKSTSKSKQLLLSIKEPQSCRHLCVIYVTACWNRHSWVAYLKHIFTWKYLHNLGANAHVFTEGLKAWLNLTEADGKVPRACRNQIKREHVVPSTQVCISKGDLCSSPTTKPCPMCLFSLKTRFSFYQTQIYSLLTDKNSCEEKTLQLTTSC